MLVEREAEAVFGFGFCVHFHGRIDHTEIHPGVCNILVVRAEGAFLNGDQLAEFRRSFGISQVALQCAGKEVAGEHGVMMFAAASPLG